MGKTGLRSGEETGQGREATKVIFIVCVSSRSTPGGLYIPTGITAPKGRRLSQNENNYLRA